MIKNSVLILLIAGFFACNSSTQKQTAPDSAKEGTSDTSLTSSAAVQDSAANKLIASDTSNASLVSVDRLIMPGKGIGHIMVNDDAETAVKLLGRPDSSDAAMGSALMVWFAKHNIAGYRTSIFAHRNMGGKDEAVSRIQKILITSPWFKTADGVGVGSSLAAIKKGYTVKLTSGYNAKTGKVEVYTDLDKGISFEVDKTSDKCVAVVIHKVHDTAATYINMH
ncbi:hypothetical protein [Mucilaginibacter dorajii]|uniref:Lipoprotein n=1 Tax=Mucilaginibacter dorajii TaxID=692994 RepID=A0ABP7QFE0_9SPHI|nr:hypothetical protein [Mucilaginibacter dorajii]MCS3736030.1 hypothetical protein [Mucilaginibacter dorajii]